MVKWFVGSLLSVILVLMSASAGAQEREWYEGGNLHKVRMAVWAVAQTSNRLATAADLSMALANDEKKPFRNAKQMMSAALYLADCLDDYAQYPDGQIPLVAATAVLCWKQYKLDNGW